MSLVRPLLQKAGATLLALSIGTIGAIVLKTLNAPVAYMLGAFLFTMLAALCKLPVWLPSWFRLLAVPAIGVMLGSYFSSEVVGNAIQWWDGLVATGLMISFALIVGPHVYRRIAGCDPMTALLSSTPGGAAEMTMLAEHYGANRRIVALSQTLRVATTALCLSMGLWATGHAGLSLRPLSGGAIASFDWAVLIGSALIGCLLARTLRVPAGAMLGPVVFSAMAHSFGLTSVTPPALVVNIAQIVIGTSLGVHFTHIHDIRAARIVAASTITAMLLLAAGLVIACIYAIMGWRDFAPIFLGIAPGGLSEMAVITVSLGIEVAFVTTCHVARLFLIIGISPLVAARHSRKRDKAI